MPRRFGEQTHEELEEARAVASEVIKTYGDFDEVDWVKFREHGIWNDHTSVQAAIRVIMDRNDAGNATLGGLNDPFYAGTRVTNCVVHSGPLTERPEDCPRCLADLRNQLSFAIRVNDFLNAKVDRAKAALNRERI